MPRLLHKQKAGNALKDLSRRSGAVYKRGRAFYVRFQKTSSVRRRSGKPDWVPKPSYLAGPSFPAPPYDRGNLAKPTKVGCAIDSERTERAKEACRFQTS